MHLLKKINFSYFIVLIITWIIKSHQNKDFLKNKNCIFQFIYYDSGLCLFPLVIIKVRGKLNTSASPSQQRLFIYFLLTLANHERDVMKSEDENFDKHASGRQQQ
jgi:hypothetical protein